MGTSRGVSLVELLVVLALISLAMAAALPSLAYLRDEGKAGAGARYLATSLSALRWKAVASHRVRGFFFELGPTGWVWWEVEDGNGNDLRTAEIRSGTDPKRSGPHRLDAFVTGATLGFPPVGSIPKVPPSSGSLLPPDDPVRFGASDVISFSPAGSASSGTLYVTDGKRGLFAVVLFGPTARLRVWRYGARERRWTL